MVVASGKVVFVIFWTLSLMHTEECDDQQPMATDFIFLISFWCPFCLIT